MGNPGSLTALIQAATNIVMYSVLWGAPVLFFAWMVGDIVWTSGNPEKRKQAGGRLLWAVIALFVLFSLGGILTLFHDTLFGQ